MFIAANFLRAAAGVLDLLLTILYWLILVRALISWVNPDPFNPIVQFLYKATEPILNPIRRILPFTYTAGIDFSPVVAFFAIIFLKGFIVKSLIDLSYRIT
ncbi:MAG: YggT family protein [Candidatus Omnitrophica bacterium]|nr:YggT family protein [Candidatus Omnitrophota bacterium]